jgi:outer membrane receptor protein involved in Fe transport
MNIKKVLLLPLVAISLSLTAQETENVNFELEEVVVTAQGREEKMLEVPITMSSLSGEFLEQTNTTNLPDLSNFVPGLNIRVQTPHRPTFVIRGLTSDEVSPTAQPRVSTYFNNAPISRASMAKSNLFDMERVEVVRGPQGTLFGRGAQIGGINFITRKPVSNLEGYVGAGIGNFGMKEIEGVINAPIIENKLMIRAGGSHTYRDGYVENLSGGKNLGSENSTDLRFSLRYLPVTQLRIDLTVDYQNDSDNGTPFMSKRFPNLEGNKDIFDLKASLDPDKEFYNKRKLFGTMLDMNYYLNENSFITSLTSFHDNKGDSRWDGDGTQASAIDMKELIKANQFTQEFRYNLKKDRFGGFVGASYWREDVKQDYGFMPNEQYLVWLLMDGMQPGMGDYMILPNGTPNPMPVLEMPYEHPQFGPIVVEFPLPGEGERQELKKTSAINSAYDIFANFDYNITDKLVFTAGLRGTWDNLSIADITEPVEGSAPSTLGMLNPNYNPENPNFLFAVSPLVEDSKTYFAATYRANLKYLINDKATVFGGYSKGRRPHILQPLQTGGIEELNAEKVDNFELGFKYLKRGKFWLDAGLFYFLYNDFQAATMQGMQYLIVDAGKAQSYGAELNANVTVCNYLDVFGNYAYIHARFDKDESNSIFAGNRFRLTPDHSFALGLNAKTKITNDIGMVFTPTYSYKSKIWFEDDNNSDLTQDAYGILNLNLAFRFYKQGLNVSLFCNNVTNEKYVISAGNTGTMFGVPTFVPGLPTTFGTRVKWSF